MGNLILGGQTLSAAVLDQYYGYSDTTNNQVTGTGPANLSTPYVIPANEPVAGSAYVIECGGSGTWGSTAQDMTFSLYLQGNVICNNMTVSNAVFNTSAGFRWKLRADLACASAGASGSFFGGYMATLTQAANHIVPGTVADNTVPVADANTGSGTTIDTTANMTAVIKVGFASNTGSPTIQCFRTIFRKVA